MVLSLPFWSPVAWSSTTACAPCPRVRAPFTACKAARRSLSVSPACFRVRTLLSRAPPAGAGEREVRPEVFCSTVWSGCAVGGGGEADVFPDQRHVLPGNQLRAVDVQVAARAQGDVAVNGADGAAAMRGVLRSVSDLQALLAVAETNAARAGEARFFLLSLDGSPGCALPPWSGSGCCLPPGWTSLSPTILLP
ncbi:Uncharacterised protein [Leclercia adecarboxylata]|uniref:Uncharacterized protein n=1 Tax=Leclercia adecarboxylata TaxID=83655 RepID=A0A4V6JMQ9_9ENTR|nr:Uncharacterised protein [Leclercia adecarboxylata]